ncbi:Lcl C-terminal domain-containing protein [Hydrogenophaga soli]
MKSSSQSLHALALLWAAVCATPALAQTGLLNDTGQTGCYDATNSPVVCTDSSTGNASARPHQDGRYGRDAAKTSGALPTKTGGGAAGFDFSCVLWNGTVVNGSNCTAGLVANTTGTPSASPAMDWACTLDNVTGLVWSLQTPSATWDAATTASYPDAGHNSASRCGYSNGWRLPSTRELLSIVHHGLSAGPMVDTAYLPTPGNLYWSRETYAPNPVNAWVVIFGNGDTDTRSKSSTNNVRLVRSKP